MNARLLFAIRLITGLSIGLATTSLTNGQAFAQSSGDTGATEKEDSYKETETDDYYPGTRPTDDAVGEWQRFGAEEAKDLYLFKPTDAVPHCRFFDNRHDQKNAWVFVKTEKEYEAVLSHRPAATLNTRKEFLVRHSPEDMIPEDRETADLVHYRCCPQRAYTITGCVTGDQQKTKVRVFPPQPDGFTKPVDPSYVFRCTKMVDYPGDDYTPPGKVEAVWFERHDLTYNCEGIHETVWDDVNRNAVVDSGETYDNPLTDALSTLKDDVKTPKCDTRIDGLTWWVLDEVKTRGPTAEECPYGNVDRSYQWNILKKVRCFHGDIVDVLDNGAKVTTQDLKSVIQTGSCAQPNKTCQCGDGYYANPSNPGECLLAPMAAAKTTLSQPPMAVKRPQQWSDFMNDHAVWTQETAETAAPASASWLSFSTKVDVPSPGALFKFSMAADGYGEFYVDDTQMLAMSGNGTEGAIDDTRWIPKGTHTIMLRGHKDPTGASWSADPVGVAGAVWKVVGNELVYDSRSVATTETFSCPSEVGKFTLSGSTCVPQPGQSTVANKWGSCCPDGSHVVDKANIRCQKDSYQWTVGDWSTCGGAQAEWAYDGWSDCSASTTCAGTGTQSRNAWCAWVAGTGTQTRAVTCTRDYDGWIGGGDAMCAGQPKPLESQACTPPGGGSCDNTPVKTQDCSSPPGTPNCAQTGKCGPANGGKFSSAAEISTAQLCSSGSASSVPTGDGPWTWFCLPLGAGGAADEGKCYAGDIGCNHMETKAALVLLQDLTGSYTDDLPNLKTAMNILLANPDLRGWKVGLATFLDHDGDPYVYRKELNLTDVSTGSAAINSVIGSWSAGGGADEPESQWESIVDAINDFKGQADAAGMPLIIVLATDAPAHDNYVTPAAAAQRLKDTNTTLIGLITNYESWYSNNMATYGVKGAVLSLSSDSKNFYNALRMGLVGPECLPGGGVPIVPPADNPVPPATGGGGGSGGGVRDGGGGGGGCFIAGTMIDTPSGKTPIEKIKVGDKVNSLDVKTGKIVAGEVGEVFVHPDKPYGEITLADGTKLSVTSIHPFYVPKLKKWVPIGEIKVGTMLLKDDMKKIRLVAKDFSGGHKATVYNIHVKVYENYFANSSSVHNMTSVMVNQK